MTHKDEAQAAEALIRWLRSQDIAPGDAVPVLALAMVTAVISVVASEPRKGTGPIEDATQRLRAGIAAAAATVPEAFQKMRNKGVL